MLERFLASGGIFSSSLLERQGLSPSLFNRTSLNSRFFWCTALGRFLAHDGRHRARAERSRGTASFSSASGRFASRWAVWRIELAARLNFLTLFTFTSSCSHRACQPPAGARRCFPTSSRRAGNAHKHRLQQAAAFRRAGRPPSAPSPVERAQSAAELHGPSPSPTSVPRPCCGRGARWSRFFESPPCLDPSDPYCVPRDRQNVRSAPPLRRLAASSCAMCTAVERVRDARGAR